MDQSQRPRLGLKYAHRTALAAGRGAVSHGGLLLSLLLTILVYATVVSHGAVYDDPLWFARMTADWTPRLDLALWSYNLQLWLGQSLRGLHVANVAIHLVNGVLVYAIAMRVLRPTLATLAAFIFLLHPMQREAVNYISGRPDLLSTTFVLLMVCCVLAGLKWTPLALIAGVLALTTKSSAIVAAPLVLLTLAIPLNREPLARALGWLLAGCALLAYLVFAPVVYSAFLQPPLIDLLTYAGLQAVALWRLLLLVLIPVGFSVDHDYGWVTLTSGLLALGVLGAVVRYLWGSRRTMPLLAWAGLWVIIALAPRFVSLGAYDLWPAINEHQFLLPMVGVSLGCASLYEGVL